MTDREKVIKELENYEPYARVFSNITVAGSVVIDALELLKEQEPKEHEKAAEIRMLVGEIEDLAYWVHDYASVIEDAEKREKMAEASEYLHVLKALIKLCPDDTLNKLHL